MTLQMILVATFSLRVFRLEGIAISNSVIAALPYCPTLKILELPHCKLTEKQDAALAVALTKCASLEILDLSGNAMTDVGCAALTKALDKNVSLKILRLDENGGISSNMRSTLERKLREHMAKAA